MKTGSCGLSNRSKIFCFLSVMLNLTKNLLIIINIVRHTNPSIPVDDALKYYNKLLIVKLPFAIPFILVYRFFSFRRKLAVFMQTSCYQFQ